MTRRSKSRIVACGLLVLIALLLSNLYSASKQRRAIKQVQRFGGRVNYDVKYAPLAWHLDIRAALARSLGEDFVYTARGVAWYPQANATAQDYVGMIDALADFNGLRHLAFIPADFIQDQVHAAGGINEDSLRYLLDKKLPSNLQLELYSARLTDVALQRLIDDARIERIFVLRNHDFGGDKAFRLEMLPDGDFVQYTVVPTLRIPGWRKCILESP